VSDVLDIASYRAARKQSVEPDWWELHEIPWNLPIAHWSASSFADFNRCPRHWQERRIKKQRERSGEAMLVGRAIHWAMEVNYRQKIQSGEDLSLVELVDYFRDLAFSQVIAEDLEQTAQEPAWDTDFETARERGALMLAAYANTVAPRIQPIATEQEIRVDIGLPVPVIGFIDVETELTVIDLKSGKKKRSKPKEDWRIQAAVYGHARQKPVEFHTLSATVATNAVSIVTPLEAPELLCAPSAPERQAQINTLHQLSKMACFYMATIGPDDPWPTLGRWHDWACDYCSFRETCPAWRTT
jgi:CRISPR/Cas system-associated exonuclease Cas4 (RecB family)